MATVLRTIRYKVAGYEKTADDKFRIIVHNTPVDGSNLPPTPPAGTAAPEIIRDAPLADDTLVDIITSYEVVQ